MLVDHATFTIRSGKGGNGSNSLHHSKGLVKGGPDGGDGGNGGDVVFVGDPHLDTLASYARRRSDHRTRMVRTVARSRMLRQAW